MNNDVSDDRGDKSSRSAWLRDQDAISSTASTTKESVTTFITNNFMNDCNAVPFAVLTPTGAGNFANVLTYNLGTIGPGKRKIVRVQVRRQ